MARLSESWRSLKSVEIETLAGPWVTEAVVALTEMVVVAHQDDLVAILETATKRAGAEGVDSKFTDVRTDGQITKIEEEADLNEAPMVSVVAAELVEGLKAAMLAESMKVAMLAESMKLDRIARVVEEVHHETVGVTMGGR